jgi:hypothetical protein
MQEVRLCLCKARETAKTGEMSRVQRQVDPGTAIRDRGKKRRNDAVMGAFLSDPLGDVGIIVLIALFSIQPINYSIKSSNSVNSLFQ